MSNWNLLDALQALRLDCSGNMDISVSEISSTECTWLRAFQKPFSVIKTKQCFHNIMIAHSYCCIISWFLTPAEGTMSLPTNCLLRIRPCFSAQVANYFTGLQTTRSYRLVVPLFRYLVINTWMCNVFLLQRSKVFCTASTMVKVVVFKLCLCSCCFFSFK